MTSDIMISYGPYDLDTSVVDVDEHRSLLASAHSSKDSKVKLTGAKNLNLLYPMLADTKKALGAYMNDVVGSRFDWNFEYFHSGEPVGLHMDFDTVPWEDGTYCQILVGVIIPLEWTCKQPYTVFYDRVADEPRKQMYKSGEMRYKDTLEVITYRTKWEYDDEVLRYNPKDTFYHKQFADLKVHSVYEWKIGTMCVFDTKRWHSSSWFLTEKNLPDASTEYKRFIVGFGSIDV